jgi:hypothetical protein
MIIPNIWKNTSNVPKHQPVVYISFSFDIRPNTNSLNQTGWWMMVVNMTKSYEYDSTNHG